LTTRSLNFKCKHPIGLGRGKPLQYYFVADTNFYRDGAAEFAV
jgi:hypothetical protein